MTCKIRNATQGGEKMRLTFLDFFSGIGGFRKGMEMAGHECVGHCEIDKYANMSYKAMHNSKEGEWFGTDIRNTRADELPRADVWCFGFPCQDISVAGKQLGFRGHRSSLFFTVTRLVRDTKEEDRPKYLFIENVKNLLSVNGGYDFLKLLVELDEIGYDAEWQVLNSKYFGVPQNRERVFIVGHLRGRSTRRVFPITRDSQSTSIKVLGTTKSDTAKGTNCRSWVHDINGIVGALTSTDYKQPKQILVEKEVRAVLTPDRLNKKQNGRRIKEDGEPMFTLTSQDRHGVLIKEATKKGYAEAKEGDSINLEQPNSKTRRGRVGKGIANTLTTSCNQGVLVNCINPKKDDGTQTQQQDRVYNPNGIMTSLTSSLNGRFNIQDGYRIRKLTPKECWRLQGWPDEYYERAASVCSKSQLYKQAGNGVTVSVIYEIAKRL